jgi:CO dehydrogenase/acetyl-CoA synthase beta subunit
MRKKDVQVKEINCPRNVDGLLKGLPFRIDSQTDSNIILKHDTFVELGPPNRASCTIVLMIPETDLINDGRITLAGPDIQESSDKTLPIGQVLMVAGTGLSDDHYMELEQCQYISNRLPGYMIRFVPRRMWSRVSKMAAEKGFSFEVLGRNLMAVYKYTMPLIQAMEVIFITSSDSDVSQLKDLVKGDHKKSVQILKERYGCTSTVDCDECPYQPICEQIREMAESIKKRHEAEFLQSPSFDQKRFSRGI